MQPATKQAIDEELLNRLNKKITYGRKLEASEIKTYQSCKIDHILLSDYIESVDIEKKTINKTRCVKPTQQFNPETNMVVDFSVKEANETNKVNQMDKSENLFSFQMDKSQEFPQSACGLIKVNIDNQSPRFFTGYMIGPDLVLTAATNIWNYKEATQYPSKNIEYYPALNGSNAPLGVIKIKSAYIPQKFVNGVENGKPNPKDNYAIIHLEENIGRFTGYFGLAAFEEDDKIMLKRISTISYFLQASQENKDLKSNYPEFSFYLNGLATDEGLEALNHKLLLVDEVCEGPSGFSGSSIYYHDEETNNYYIVALFSSEKLGDSFHQSVSLMQNSSLQRIRDWIREIRRNQLIAQGGTSQLNDFELLNLNLGGRSFGNDVIKILLEYSIPNLGALSFDLNNIDFDGILMLSKHKGWPKLEVLSLSQNYLGDNSVIALTGHSNWKNLKKLVFNNNKISDEGAAAIAGNGIWSSLEELYLSNCQIGPKGGSAIGRNTLWKNLQKIFLSDNKIGDEGAIEIGKNTTWTELEELYLGGNKIGDKGAVELGLNHAWKNLRKLYLAENVIRDEGAAGLGANSSWRNLEELYLWANLIENKGAAAIGKNSSWRKLRRLALDSNKIGDGGAVGLGENTSWVRLEELSLHQNAISDKGAVGLGSNITWVNLRKLSLFRNKIGDDGAAGLGKNQSWEKLNELLLYENAIKVAGAKALGKNTTWKNLQSFDLESNTISDAGAMGLAANNSWTCLETLRVGGNKLRYRGVAALGKNIATWGNIQQISVGKLTLTRERTNSLSSDSVLWSKLRFN